MKNDKKQKGDEIYSQDFYELCNTVETREKSLRIKKYNFKLRLTVALLFSICLVSMYFIKFQFENLVNFMPKTFFYDNGLYVHFIDVGQGKAIAIRTDDGTNILIDCGKEIEKHKLFGYLEQNFFASDNAEKVFDYFILTHSDSDHIGNSVEIFEKYEIKNCCRPKVYTPAEAELYGITNSYQINNTDLYSNFVNALNNENCNVFYNFAGESICGINYIFEFLTPMQNAYSNSNSYSPIISLTYNYDILSEMVKTENLDAEPDTKKFVFTGDATLTTELEALNYNASELKADVLDISHHGSNSSSTQDFLNAVNPEYAVISVGENNYGLPADEVSERLMLSGVNFEKIIRTDKLGTIIFHISPLGELNILYKTGTYLNISDYAFAEVLISLELLVLVICFASYIPEKRQVI